MEIVNTSFGTTSNSVEQVAKCCTAGVTENIDSLIGACMEGEEWFWDGSMTCTKAIFRLDEMDNIIAGTLMMDDSVTQE